MKLKIMMILYLLVAPCISMGQMKKVKKGYKRENEGLYTAKPDLSRKLALPYSGKPQNVVFKRFSIEFDAVKNRTYDSESINTLYFGKWFTQSLIDTLIKGKALSLSAYVGQGHQEAEILTILNNYQSAFLVEGEIRQVTIDLIPETLISWTVKQPYMKMDIMIQIKKQGQILLSKNYTSFINMPPLKKTSDIYKEYPEFQKSESKRKYDPEHEKKISYFVYNRILKDLTDKNFDRLTKQVLGDIYKIFRSHASNSREIITSYDDLTEYVKYFPYTIGIRGRKWQMVGGSSHEKHTDSTTPPDILPYKVFVDGQIIDEGIIDSFRTDKKGSISKHEFHLFDSQIELELPGGKNQIMIVLDNNQNPREIIKEYIYWNQASTSFGYSLVNEHISNNTKGILFRRQLRYFHKKSKQSTLSGKALEYLSKGSSGRYYGTWEMFPYANDPYKLMERLDWENPKAQKLLAEKPRERIAAIIELASTRDIAYSPYIVEVSLMDPKPAVRKVAFEQLAKLNDGRILYFIAYGLVMDPNEGVRRMAGQYLINHKKTNSLPIIRSLLDRPAVIAPAFVQEDVFSYYAPIPSYGQNKQAEKTYKMLDMKGYMLWKHSAKQ